MQQLQRISTFLCENFGENATKWENFVYFIVSNRQNDENATFFSTLNQTPNVKNQTSSHIQKNKYKNTLNDLNTNNENAKTIRLIHRTVKKKKKKKKKGQDKPFQYPRSPTERKIKYTSKQIADKVTSTERKTSTRALMSLPFLPRSLVTTTLGEEVEAEESKEEEEEEEEARILKVERKPRR
jgi:hypothetical protein